MYSKMYTFAFIASILHVCVQGSPVGGAKPVAQPETQLVPDIKHVPDPFENALTTKKQSVWPTLPWAAFGDSFASGVTYGNWPGEDLDYDKGDPDLIHRCRRIVDAYSAQLKNDWDPSQPGWARGRVPYLYFLACSGSRFSGINDQLNDMEKQIKDSENDNKKSDPKLSDVIPEFATLTIGGNDALFFPVVSDCIFHPDVGKNYGPDYPDPKGDCAKSIDNANKQIDNDDAFSKPLTKAFTDIINHPRVKDKQKFKVLVTGYARFFNQDDPACDNYGLRPANGPLMTRPLRKALNDLVLHVNDKIGTTVANAKNPKAVFVDFDSGFQGHRFCEPNDSSGYIGNRKQRINSWFWSFSIFDNYSPPPGTQPRCDPDLDVNCPDPQLNDPEFGFQVSGVKSSGSSGNPADTPSATRTFHPKRDGHTAIKGIIQKAIDAANLADPGS